ncbi:DNA-binding response regulator [Winogradskyella thalassocola]|uniref:DNA-binding response regulator, NarL/FixJ family, contains REC and HTH domains n=1 Tax=Winogradskyella thalassocola TaxID=262004 RepID=A0A1G8B7B5_9FLAO|nr:response regulator [Winogradskyella thalassocola]SDH29129.1 DNA-binding response regulator, NarL/FixJ family, contains REC and HTH domains [Winogradskyella thalassocola]
MFKNVLINEDHDAVLANITKILTELQVISIETSQYCDEAYLKLKRAALEGCHFDLLITDLSFKKDHRVTSLESGEMLIEKLRDDFPDLPIIVYSMKDQLQKIRGLLNTYGVNAYVCKDRKGSIELTEAIQAVYDNAIYVSPQVKKALSPKSQLEIDDYDIRLLQLLSQGQSQDDISTSLKSNGITPSSLSTIEKRLNKLREHFKAHNAIHLVAITKDLGVI